MPGFQSEMNYNWALGFPGDWASTNPHRSVLTYPGGLVSGIGGVTVARFGWINDDGTVSNASGQGSGATATATVSNGGVSGFTVTAGGSGYLELPKVVITPASGDTPTTTAKAVAVVENGVVTGVNIVTAGVGYNSAPTIAITTPTAAPDGFVHRNQQGLTTAYLQQSTMLVPQGFPITLIDGGDLFAVSTVDCQRGDTVYASLTDGSVTTGAAGASITGYIATSWKVSLGASAGQLIAITRSAS